MTTHNDQTVAQRQAFIAHWYNDVDEAEMLKQVYTMIHNVKQLPTPRIRNGNFIDSFHIDIICNLASFVDDGKLCDGMKSLALSCKKYNAMSGDMWYGIIKKRALRNNSAYL